MADGDRRPLGQEPVTGGTKRTYEKPRILFREPLETLAAVCIPAPPAKGSPASCPSGPISS